MRKVLFCVIIFFQLSKVVSAQQNVKYGPRYTVQMDVVPLLNVFRSSIKAIGKYHWDTRHAGVVELDRIFDASEFTLNKGEKYKGWTMTLGREWTGKRTFGMYYAFTSIDHKMRHSVNRGDRYVQALLLHRDVIIHGFKMGISDTYPLDRKGRWNISILGRVGMQWARIRIDLPTEGLLSEETNDWFDLVHSDRLLPVGKMLFLSGDLGLRLGISW